MVCLPEHSAQYLLVRQALLETLAGEDMMAWVSIQLVRNRRQLKKVANGHNLQAAEKICGCHEHGGKRTPPEKISIPLHVINIQILSNFQT
jgi:hypothetical protein